MRFCDLKIGQRFWHGGILWKKIYCPDGENAVRVGRDDELTTFSDDARVSLT